MELVSLAWAGLWRKPARTVFTVISLAVGFLLFGLLQGVSSTFTAAMNRTQADRLIVGQRFYTPMPLSHAARIARVPGVKDVTWTEFLQTAYQTPKNFVLILGVDLPGFLKVRNEFEMTPEVIAALGRTRTGIVVLDKLARQNGWKTGDRITVTSAQTPRQDGSHDWQFDVVGIITSPANPDQFPFAIVNYEYLDSERASKKGTVGRFVIRVSDPGRSVDISHAIDAAFASSAAPTQSQLENAYAATELATIGDVGRLTLAVISAVFFAMLLMAGNVILQSVRERQAEFAVLKTIGFQDLRILTLVVVEALLLCVTAAIVGLAASAAFFPVMTAYLPSLDRYLGTPSLSMQVPLLGLVLAMGLAAIIAAIPVWNIRRLNIIEALREGV